MIDRDELTLTSAFDFARDIIKALTLVNGAAALSLLTFYGNYLSAGKTGIETSCDSRLAFVGLLSFAFGVAFSVGSGAAAYLTQLKWGVAHSDRQSANASEKSASKMHTWSIALGTVSIVLFVIGIALSACALFPQNWVEQRL
jgi:hypothetical protein